MSLRKVSTWLRIVSDCLRQLAGGLQHLMRGGTGVAGGLLNAGNVRRDFAGAERCLLHVAGNLLRRRALLFHGPAIADAISLISLIVAEMPLMAATASLDEFWIDETWAPIWSVALAVCSARLLTSDATTAKPRPASPARAASIVALSASKLVWLAISLISLTTSPMLAASLNRPCTVELVRSASPTAFCAIAADCAT